MVEETIIIKNKKGKEREIEILIKGFFVSVQAYPSRFTNLQIIRKLDSMGYDLISMSWLDMIFKKRKNGGD